MSQRLSEVLKTAGLRGAKIGKSGEYEAVTVKAEDIVELVRTLREGLGMKYLSCLTAVDYGDELELVYHTFSHKTKETIVCKVRLARTAPVAPSVSDVYPAANWFEREVIDMFGVEFTNHPNPLRMLRLDDQEGYPLRKDYALRARIPAVEDAD